MAPLLKDGSATLEQALDLARRRDFGRARQKFIDASEKFRKEGDILLVNVAKAYADLLSPEVLGGNPGALFALAGFLRATLGTTELRPGPRGIAASDLATQLELTARDTNLMSALQSGPGAGAPLSQALQQLANDYVRLGGEVLFLPELSFQRSTTASARVPVLMALSFETLGQATEASDPLSAADHFQAAQQYWNQAGDEARAQAAGVRVGHLSIQAKCWICGREGRGHGVQFVSLPIDQDVMGLKGTDTSPLPSIDASSRNVYVCKGCLSALRGLADRIAIQRASEAEMRLLSRIQAIEAALATSR